MDFEELYCFKGLFDAPPLWSGSESCLKSMKQLIWLLLG